MGEKQTAPKTKPQSGPGRHGMATDFRRAKDTKGTLLKLGALLAEYKLRLFVVAILMVIAAFFGARAPYILGKATNEVADGIGRSMAGTGFVDMAALSAILIQLAALYLGNNLFSYLQSFLLVGMTQKLTYTLTQKIETKLHYLPLSYFDSTPYGDILSRVTNDVSTVTSSLQQNLPNMLSSLLQLSMVLVAMLALSPGLTLISMVTLPLTVLFSAKIVKFSQRYFRGQQESLGDMSGYVEENFSGHHVIKAYGREQVSIDTFNGINERLYSYSWKSLFLSGLIMPVTMFFSNLSYVLIAVIGGIAAMQGKLKIGFIQSFIQYLRQFSQPLSQMANMFNLLQSTIAAAERVFDFLEETEELPDPANPQQIALPKGEVALEHVRFGYSPDKTLIKDLSIQLKSGDKVAIVGPTGAGKTTLVNLLLRFYDIQGGRITIDGVDIMQMSRNGLRSLFGMVLQDTWLFSGTIEENIRYGRLDASDEEVREAARAAYIDGFIRTQPKGYDTFLGEDATNISGGQRQLLTIARAILSDPAIMILDEATSSVDTRTELLIQKAMLRLMENRTSFVIAHRLSTIRDAQMILVMNQGDIVETGNHNDLLAKGGFYADLYNSQFSGAALNGK